MLSAPDGDGRSEPEARRNIVENFYAVTCPLDAVFENTRGPEAYEGARQ